MNKCAFLMAPILLLTSPLTGSGLQNQCHQLSKRQMQSVIEFLSSDLLEGRAPGTRGGELAEIYLHSLFKLLGLTSRFQPFPLQGFQTRDMQVEVGAQRLLYLEDVVGNYTRDEKEFSLEGDAVFAGFGIRTSIYDWDDYKESNLRDKILIIRVNDPGLFNPGVFEGGVLTYFGRWTYKIEEAAKTGAKAILLIHTTPTAGYDWNVVKNSWGGESLDLPASLENNLAFKGWIKEDSLKSILKDKNIDLDSLYRQSLSRTFTPVDLGFRMKISGHNDFRRLEARNVIGEIPGRSGKSIVISAHIDHLGRNERLSGDQIFNGAIDNGSAVAAMVMVAKIFAASGRELNYGLTFLACQAEEEGLLGSKYFVANADREHIVANINLESSPVWERSLDAFALGARYSTLEEAVKKTAAEMGLEYSEFSLTDQGFYYRSDQFSFARFNIPAIWLSAGEKFASGRNRIREFFKGGAYHTVKDEYNPDWELESLKQTVQLAVMLIERLDRSQEIPQWKTRLTFPVESTAAK